MGAKSLLKKRHYSMLYRCYNPSEKWYYMYGGRGIKVCDEWIDNFDSFFEWALSNGFKKNLQLDRIDTNGNYCPSNCRWVTAKENSNNTRKNVVIEYFGKKQSLTLWCEELGLHYPTIHARIHKYNWNPIKALTKPVRSLK